MVSIQGQKFYTNEISALKNNLNTYFSHSMSLKKAPNCDYFAKSTPIIRPMFCNLDDKIIANSFPHLLLAKYANKDFLEKAAKTNPEIQNILNKANLKGNVNVRDIDTCFKSHLLPAQNTAIKIMKNSGENFSASDFTTMSSATILHDIGKAYIPTEILNKPAKLTKDEKEIVDLHAKLGYEALKTGGVDPKVLNLVKNHHQYEAQSGRKSTPMEQIIQISDIYSALKEKRCYKESFSDEKALSILYNEAKCGNFDAKYVDALKKSLSK